MTRRTLNLLFVFSDQQSFDMIGSSGNAQIITPNIDRLAEDGIRFTYCVSSDPVCTPTRAMILSGQHPLKCGAFTNDVLTDILYPPNAAYAGYASGNSNREGRTNPKDRHCWRSEKPCCSRKLHNIDS